MGVFMVNLENYNIELSKMSKYWWQILMTVGFFLIWNKYPRTSGRQKFLYWGLQIAGILLLVYLAVIFKGGSAENPVWIKTYWWGILGLIGWAYFYSAFIYLFARSNLTVMIIALVFFNLLNLADFTDWLDFLSGIRKYVWIVGSGSMPAFTMAGVVALVIYMKLRDRAGKWEFLVLMFGLAKIMFAFEFGTRPLWGISKIRATPAWIGI